MNNKKLILNYIIIDLFDNYKTMIKWFPIKNRWERLVGGNQKDLISEGERIDKVCILYKFIFFKNLIKSYSILFTIKCES